MSKGINLSIPQSDVTYSTKPSVACVAGFGSGKTHAALMRAFQLLHWYPGIPQGYAGITYQLIKDIWFPAVEEHCIEHGYKYSINKSDYTIDIHGLGKIVCRSLSNPNKIVGFEVGDFLLDEMDVLKTPDALNAWRKCKARCRKPYPKRKILTRSGYKKIKKKNQMFAYTTPEGFKATYEMFEKTPLKNSELIQMSTYSNAANLPEDYIEELMANYPPELVQAYIYGKFVNLTSGAVWTSYDRFQNRTREVHDGEEPIIIGQDFNVGRGCAVIYVKRPIGLCAVDEITATLDTPATLKVLKERYGNVNGMVIPDASGDSRKSVNATTSDLTLVRQAGWRVVKNNKNPNIKDRVMATNALFCNAAGERRLYVNDAKCPNLADGLEQQVYDKNGLPEKGEGKMDDITDAGTYPVAKLFPIRKINAQLLKVQGI